LTAKLSFFTPGEKDEEDKADFDFDESNGREGGRGISEELTGKSKKRSAK